MSYPPNCGERYQHLLVEDCSWLCTEFEYAAALEKVQVVNRELISAWNSIFALDDARGNYTVTERWRDEHNNWDAEFATLPEPWSMEFWQDAFSWDMKGRYADAQRIASTGACLLDAMVTDGQAAYGDIDVQGPPTPAPPAPEPPSTLDVVADTAKTVAGVVGVVLVVGIGWVVFDKARKG
jgi:hypothetical protein